MISSNIYPCHTKDDLEYCLPFVSIQQQKRYVYHFIVLARIQSISSLTMIIFNILNIYDEHIFHERLQIHHSIVTNVSFDSEQFIQTITSWTDWIYFLCNGMKTAT